MYIVRLNISFLLKSIYIFISKILRSSVYTMWKNSHDRLLDERGWTCKFKLLWKVLISSDELFKLMSSKDSIDVTLALVDPTLLSSWEGMVKRGEECSLLLKHSKGKITATLQCTTPTTPSSSTSSPSSSAKKRKKSKGSKEKRLKALLDYHQRLVVEKGLPPSRLMEQHAAASTTAPSSPAQSSGPKEKQLESSCW